MIPLIKQTVYLALSLAVKFIGNAVLILLGLKKLSSTPDDGVSKDTVRCHSTELKFNSSEHYFFRDQSVNTKGKGRGLMLFAYERWNSKKQC